MSTAAEGKLSERLGAVAELVTEGSRLADIGTDHAWLPIHLCLSRKIPSAIAADVREGPLAGAAEHIRAAGLEEKIKVRLSDGLTEILPEEADCVVVTGMGGNLICSILGRNAEKTASFQELILGPQSETELVRRFLEEHGFAVIREKMICEDGKYYPVMKAIPEKNGTRKLTAEELAFGPCLLREKDPVLREWLERKRKTDDRILRELEEVRSPSAEKRIPELREEVQLLEAALKRYEM